MTRWRWRRAPRRTVPFFSGRTVLLHLLLVALAFGALLGLIWLQRSLGFMPRCGGRHC